MASWKGWSFGPTVNSYQSDSDSDHLLQTPLGQTIYAICDKDEKKDSKTDSYQANLSSNMAAISEYC